MQIKVLPFHFISDMYASLSSLYCPLFFITKASNTSNPMLWRVWLYSLPTLPNPTIKNLFMRANVNIQEGKNSIIHFFQSLNKFIQSLNKFIQSLNKFIQPLNKFIQSLNKFIQSLNKFIQSLNKFIQPLNKFIQPLNKFVQSLNKFV